MGTLSWHWKGLKQKSDHYLKKVPYDERHTGVIVLSSRAIEEREFAEWTIGFANTDKAEDIGVAGVTVFLQKGYTLDTVKANPS
jgi:hypothetical protein